MESNFQSVVLDFQRDIVLAESNLGNNLRRAALDSVAIIGHRIQQKGMNADGQRMQTKAKLKMRAYSKLHAKHRSERGRQIDHVDFTNDGDLMNSFAVITVSPRLVTAGFLSDDMADRAEYLEAYFGEAFALSIEEEKIVLDGLAENILDNIEK